MPSALHHSIATIFTIWSKKLIHQELNSSRSVIFYKYKQHKQSQVYCYSLIMLIPADL